MAATPNLAPRQHQKTISNSGVHKRIIDATVELFVEMGYSQVTTNLIARRADVSVGSVYRFYPNKFALFNAITETFFAALDRTLDEFLLAADPAAPFEQQVDLLGERMATLWQENRMLIQAWGVLTGSPEIEKVDKAYAEKSTKRIAAYLPRIAAGRSQSEYAATARLTYWMTLHTLDAATIQSDAFDHAILAEYKTMLKAYVREFSR